METCFYLRVVATQYLTTATLFIAVTTMSILFIILFICIYYFEVERAFLLFMNTLPVTVLHNKLAHSSSRLLQIKII